IGTREKAKIKALVDTGFSGWLCLPTQTAKDLGLILAGYEKFELATGQWITQLKFKGQVRFQGRTQDVEILLTDSEMPQLGIQMLADCRLAIDFLTNTVRIQRKKL